MKWVRISRKLNSQDHVSLPSFLRGWGWFIAAVSAEGQAQLPHTAQAQLSLPSTARHKMQMCGTAMQWGSQRAPDSTPNFLTPSHSRGWETEVTHLKGPACRSSIGDIAALLIKSITPAALAQAYCYFSHIRSLRLSCKSGLM